MPAIFERTFRVRHYECDAYGHLNNVNYLRLMQETAYDASAAVGYGMLAYQETGRRWFVRETQIEYLQPVFYGDSLTVRTWVEDFHRVRSIRKYEIYTQENERLAARAWTDWVYLDALTNQPVSIPPEMIKAFIPEWERAQSQAHQPRPRFPQIPPPPARIFSQRRRVEWGDLDPAQHVNNAAYIGYLQECGTLLGDAFGWSKEKCTQQGFMIVPRRHHIEYRQQARLGDEIEITTWLSDVRRSMATRHYQIRRVEDGELLAQDHTLYVWVDLQTNQVIRIPAGLLVDFAANISGAEQ